MVENRKSEGLNFLLCKLPAANDKNKLVELAHETLCMSHSKRTFMERRSKDLNLLALGLGERIGRIHAMTNTVVTTNDKLYLIIKKYVDLEQRNSPKISEKTAIDNFCKELRERCPKEYGVEHKEKVSERQPFNLIMKSAKSRGIV